ncbi:hypothetical protein J5226_18180 [Lysobacter sp. K5869]|uniref:hypothetical protein n=1 Tax=Lysobacter sp. K5869 TaxID=2820808 RepID=UPI001C05F182|nr:hypothetical protein [Lysobacter sp. K5869]QWP75526.1 hypothetical protein J5226_18180 [Lysobacter sp. K5869]
MIRKQGKRLSLVTFFGKTKKVTRPLADESFKRLIFACRRALLRAEAEATSKWVPAFAGMTVGRVSAIATCEKRSSHSVIPAKAGTHFDFAVGFALSEATSDDKPQSRAFRPQAAGSLSLSCQRKQPKKGAFLVFESKATRAHSGAGPRHKGHPDPWRACASMRTPFGAAGRGLCLGMRQSKEKQPRQSQNGFRLSPE